MSAPSLASQIEAILYLKGQPVPLADLATQLGRSREETEEALLDLLADYAHRDTALAILETPKGYSLQLRESFEPLIEQLVPADLGVGAIRTLAAIALKGPIAQTELVAIRGSGAYQHVQELVERGFVRKRRQPQGRSFLVQVTEQFHRYFQIDSDDEQELEPLLKLLQDQVQAAAAAADAETATTEDAATDPEAP
jgi:segregation and condensation protein B